MFHLMIVQNVEFDLQHLENAMTYKGVFPRNLAYPLLMVQMKKKTKTKTKLCSIHKVVVFANYKDKSLVLLTINFRAKCKEKTNLMVR